MAKKAATKKTTAKKPTAKKPAAKKPAAKKASAAKPAAKKPAAKKPAAKKPAAKKPAAKKAAPKVIPTAAQLATGAATKKKAVKKPTAAKASAAAAAPSKGGPLVLGKHPRKSYPEGSTPDDFQCFGPPATKDGEFDKSRICDMGCFTQDGKDSNKYYHGAVVQHRGSKNWYAYFEWGRTGASRPDFLFVGCRDEAHAAAEYAKQLHSKNDKRGQWVTVAGLKTLQAKKGKDCYLVRPQATRATGLPDARSIKTNEGARADKVKGDAKTKGKKSSASSKADPQTLALMRDLQVATVAYTRGSMADDSLPTQTAIDEARQILTEAQKRVGKVGDDIDAQVKDKEIQQMTALMYGRIPKRKPVGAAAETWVLSGNNILAWQNDLDAFESALYSTDIDHGEQDFDPFEGMKLDMSWIDPKSDLGKYLHKWWPKATNNRHGWIRGMKIKNLWKVDRHDSRDRIPDAQKFVLKDKPKIKERALFQDIDTRPDLSAADKKAYKDSNTALMFHGTRSVNVSGILRESLRMPKTLVGVVITGAMFGPGLYFADDWKKSAGYTSIKGSYWASGGGTVQNREAFMFACDVVLGAPFVAPGAKGYTEPPKGYHSVFGKAGKSQVANNEFIVYQTMQSRLRYLAEFSH